MLNGRPALVVEEEFLIALDVQRMLETLGVGQTLFARHAADAAGMLDSTSDLAVAIIEARRNPDHIASLVERLRSTGVSVVVTVADVATQHHYITHMGLPAVIKPVAEADLANAIRQALRG